jgi:hypothetical protein
MSITALMVISQHSTPSLDGGEVGLESAFKAAGVGLIFWSSMKVLMVAYWLASPPICPRS